MTEEKDIQKKPLKSYDVKDGLDTNADDFRGLDKGWSWVVMMASFGGFVLIGGTMYAVGIIHSTLLEQFKENVATTSWAGALHSALISAGGPLSSAVIDHGSCRTAIVLSGCCYVIGYFATAFAPNIRVAILTCGIIAGLGGAFGYTALIVVVGFNFHRRRNIALGVALSGVGVGMFVMAPIMQLSREYYGTSGFFIILATMAANIITFGVMCFPSNLEISASRKRKTEHMKRDECKTSRFSSLRGYGRVALNKSIMCLCMCMFNYCLGTFLIYLHLPTYVEHKGFTPTQASIFVSISGIMSVVGRILTGFVAGFESIPDIGLYSGSMGIVATVTLLLPLYSKFFAGNVIYAVVLGLFFGSCYVVTASVSIRFVGIEYMAAAIGLELFFGGIGAIVGPVLAGVIVDSGGSYDQSFIVAGFCILLASILSGISVCFNDKTSKTTSENGGIEIYVEETSNVLSEETLAINNKTTVEPTERKHSAVSLDGNLYQQHEIF